MPRETRDSILPHPAVFAATTAVTVVAWSLGGLLWSGGNRTWAVSAFALGLSLGPCLTGYVTAPRPLKQLQRRVVLATGGVSILAPSLLAATSLDLEGFFLLLFAGTAGAALGHTLVTVIVGPLALGRVLCGWGCWRAMVLELLPVGRGSGRRGGVWRALPYLGLVTSAGAAAFCFYALGHRPAGVTGTLAGAGVLPVLVACGVYYLASIGLALALHDQRAFCKYLCPSSAILRWTSRPALLRVAANVGACDGCGACTRVCPMDIDIAPLASAGLRIGLGECILCQRCVQACTRSALQLTFGPTRAARPRGARGAPDGLTSTPNRRGARGRQSAPLAARGPLSRDCFSLDMGENLAERGRPFMRARESCLLAVVVTIAAATAIAQPSGSGSSKAPLAAKCSAGEASACRKLGDAYYGGTGVAQDKAKAVRLYQKACDGGNALGCASLAVLYASGEGIAQDASKAAQLCQRACDLGNAMGCANLGFLYARGQGVEQNVAKATQLYQRGCDGGDTRGCINLGLLYQDGQSVARDVGRAAQLYQKACEGGDAGGGTNLGVLYESGQGVPQHRTKTAQFYRQACDGGNAQGCANLGITRASSGATTPATERAPAQDRHPIDITFYRTGRDSVHMVFDVRGRGILCDAAEKTVVLETPSEAMNPWTGVHGGQFLVIPDGDRTAIPYGTLAYVPTTLSQGETVVLPTFTRIGKGERALGEGPREGVWSVVAGRPEALLVAETGHRSVTTPDGLRRVTRMFKFAGADDAWMTPLGDKLLVDRGEGRLEQIGWVSWRRIRREDGTPAMSS